MKIFICSEFSDDGYVEAENINEAKIKMCTPCIEENVLGDCDGPIEADSSEIPAIKASKNLLENIGAYIHEMKESIMELIAAIDGSNHCETCSDEFGTSACSECPWFQAKSKALKLLKQVE